MKPHRPLRLSRRCFLRTAVALAAVSTGGLKQAGAAGESGLRLAAFRADVTPPVGSPLCAGLVKPVAKVADPLSALGVVIFGAGQPIVLCVVDWCEIHNADHVFWREQLARAAGTVPERVAVQTVHQHDAPLADSGADRLLQNAEASIRVFDVAWGRQTLEHVADALRESVRNARPLTHVATGEAKVLQVASNRRILGPDGKVRAMRYSATRDPELRAEPEGVIDPYLKSVSFWSGDRKLAVLHYYATHPMSHYANGEVSCDFVGLARDRRSAEDSGAMHIYFTGCGGNITAGKYNDGKTENRGLLASRIYAAIQEAERNAKRILLDRVEWRTKPLPLSPRPDLRETNLLQIINAPTQSRAARIAAAAKVSYLRHASAGKPIHLGCLAIGDGLRILHLPGEPFVEYQLFVQQQMPGKFAAVAGYGDVGPGYLPLAKSFEEGGYEPSWAFADPKSETQLKDSMLALLKP